MSIVRKIILFRHHNFGRCLARNFQSSSGNQEASPSTQPQVQEEKFDFEDIQVLERTERRKPKIDPFMKNVFVSVFNRDLLAYPEILNKDETADMDLRISVLDSVFGDPKMTIEDRKEALKRSKLYAGPVSLTMGGLAQNITESLRYLETISSDVDLSQQISDHWVGLEALKLGLEPDQYQKIIDDLITGERSITLCIKEKVASRITQADFRTQAELDSQGIWRISGEKLCHKVDGYLLVLCTVETTRLNAFLVHPGAEGISHDGHFVNFLKTPGIPLDKVSEPDLAKTLGLSRLYMSTLSRATLQRAIFSTSDYVHSRAFNGKPLSELASIRSTFGDALMTLYAAESAEYFTAGLLDKYMEPDAEMEVAMCRTFMAKHAMPTLHSLLEMTTVEDPETSARRMDEMRKLQLQGETLDSVNTFIAMNGIHHAGKMMAEEVKKIRNPAFNPAFIFKKVISDRHQEKDDPKLTLYLAEHLHHSLQSSAEQLEYCVLRMKYACETLMSRHSVKIATATTELNRLAEAATYILMMTSVLARASRSYCIGLRNAEVEMKLAACFVEVSREKVRKLILDIDNGEFLNLDRFRIEFGKKILDTKTLIVEKPIARVFW